VSCTTVHLQDIIANLDSTPRNRADPLVHDDLTMNPDSLVDLNSDAYMSGVQMQGAQAKGPRQLMTPSSMHKRQTPQLPNGLGAPMTPHRF
jgi:hypothetical protein